MDEEKAGSSSESEEQHSPRKARRAWLDKQLKEAELEMEAVNQGKHPELLKKAALLEEIKTQRLQACERYQEQRLRNLQHQYEAERKQVADQHEADLLYLRTSLLESVAELRKKLEHELHKSPHDHADHRIPTRRTRRRRIPQAVPSAAVASAPSASAPGPDLPADATPAYNLDYTTQFADVGGRKKVVAPPGLKKALNINLTLKADEIQSDLRLIQTLKRPPPLAPSEEDRHAKTPKLP